METEEFLLFFSRLKCVSLVPSPEPSRFEQSTSYEIRDSFQQGAPALHWNAPGHLLVQVDTADIGSTVTFPQVPAPVPELRKVDNKSAQISLPSCLAQPLQKATRHQESDHNKVVVYPSGMRSAIYRDGDSLYRLKGCGNGIDNSSIDSAFPVRYVGQDAIRVPLTSQYPLNPEILSTPIEFRGAMFDFTAKREQAITSIVNDAIQRKGIPVGNIPAGFYRYKDLQLQTATNSKETVSLCCGLYRTFGDKRLASHLLWGLELLIPLIFNELSAAATGQEVNLEPPSSASGISWCHSVFPVSRITGTEVVDTGFAALEGSTNLANLLKISIDASALKLQGGAIPAIPTDVDVEAWSELWRKSWRELLKAPENLGNALSAMYWSIGRQCGNITRAIHDENVNWGTYEDLLGNHCNSHPNNLIILSSPQNAYFLAPLDFDLAFTRKSFQPAKCSSFEESEAAWKELQGMEMNAMILALGGLNLNSGVEGRADLPESLEPIRVALRDTMVTAAFGAYEKEEDLHAAACRIYEPLFQPLIRLALILSEHVVA